MHGTVGRVARKNVFEVVFRVMIYRAPRAIRLSNMLAQTFSAERTASDGTPEENTDGSAEELLRGAGPKYTDAPGFHLFNVVVHAATCASSTWLFRCVFAGKGDV